jgi:hypothetical protein
MVLDQVELLPKNAEPSYQLVYVKRDLKMTVASKSFRFESAMNAQEAIDG